MRERGRDSQLATYQIQVRGDLGKLSPWFDGVSIVRQINGEMLLTGTAVDQDALHRVLRRIRDLGLPVRYLQVSEAGLGRRGRGGG